jgi:hypothetical protein
MVEDKKNNFAVLGIIAIVGIVAIVGLIMMMGQQAQVVVPEYSSVISEEATAPTNMGGNAKLTRSGDCFLVEYDGYACVGCKGSSTDCFITDPKDEDAGKILHSYD